MQTRTGLLPLAVALLLLTGCSVANPFAPKDTAAKQRQDAEQTRLKWAQCMRDHGADVPDPVNGRQTVRVDAGSQQVFEAAMEACKQYVPNGGPGTGQPDPKMLDAATRFAQCMRDHGIPLEDPQASGGGIKIGGPGQGSKIDPESEEFKQAEQACQHFLDEVKPKQP